MEEFGEIAMEMGSSKKTKKRLHAKVFWDKNNDGEHNSSNEPSLETNEAGEFF